MNVKYLFDGLENLFFFFCLEGINSFWLESIENPFDLVFGGGIAVILEECALQAEVIKLDAFRDVDWDDLLVEFF